MNRAAAFAENFRAFLVSELSFRPYNIYGMEQMIQVNFNRPVPIFPLADTVLLPHSLQHLHIFEKRYRQMIGEGLDGPGQIALASFADRTTPDVGESESPSSLRPVVCVGQIMHHHRFADGRYNVILVGLCRARIVELIEPTDDRLYRVAHLELHESDAPDADLSDVRERLLDLIRRPRLETVRGMSKVRAFFERDEIPTSALLELLGSTLTDDLARRYELLAESNVRGRASLIGKELKSIDRLVRNAEWQFSSEWPKGMSWN